MIKKVVTEEWETSDHKKFPIHKEREALQHEVEYLESRMSLLHAANNAFATTSEDSENSSEWCRGRYLGSHE
jgi:hypothetical protein